MWSIRYSLGEGYAKRRTRMNRSVQWRGKDETKTHFQVRDDELFFTSETITVTSSSFPPVNPTYPAAWAASANGLRAEVDPPTSCALVASTSAMPYITQARQEPKRVKNGGTDMRAWRIAWWKEPKRLCPLRKNMIDWYVPEDSNQLGVTCGQLKLFLSHRDCQRDRQ